MSAESNDDESGTVEGDTTLAALSHASALVASVLGPVLFLVLADDDDQLVKENAKNSLNFQIVMFIAFLVSGILTIVVIGLLLIPIFAIIDLVLVLIATVKANNGEVYEYPYTPSII
ncbi:MULTISPECIES: DUF4870 domain-containing protein [Haloferacaceae]|uniref:DUF4870 domain-containing protein n=1 Tax=Halorubrum glutamatedens TaxID=2707018 RepID=A0ABD5QW08_9EURY|nr:DUF4870 domain-containing protein [Halobellus captivus]